MELRKLWKYFLISVCLTLWAMCVVAGVVHKESQPLFFSVLPLWLAFNVHNDETLK